MHKFYLYTINLLQYFLDLIFICLKLLGKIRLKLKYRLRRFFNIEVKQVRQDIDFRLKIVFPIQIAILTVEEY